MSQIQKSKKKFIPPLKAAASMFKSIPEKFQANEKSSTPILDFQVLQKRVNHRTLSSVSFSRTQVRAYKSSESLNQKALTAYSRDITYLQDLKNIRFESEASQDGLADLERLKLLLKSSQSQTSRRCSQDYMRKISVNSTDVSNNALTSFDEFYKNNDSGRPTGQYDFWKLKEWFGYMKENLFSQVIEDKEKFVKIIAPERLNEYEVILSAGVKEFYRQLSLIHGDRGQMFLEIIQYLTLFWNGKTEDLKKKEKMSTEESQKTFENTYKDLTECQSKLREKDIQFSQEISLIKSQCMLKDIEIENLNRTIVRLKAERVYRMKTDIHGINELMKNLNQLKQIISEKNDMDDCLMIQKNLNKKKDYLVSIIAREIKKLNRKSSQDESGFTYDHKIAHAMISIDSENIFLDKEIQVYSKEFSTNKSTQAEYLRKSVYVETEEIADFVYEHNLAHHKKQKSKGQNFNIFITDVNSEKNLVFSKKISLDDSDFFSSSQDELSEIEQIQQDKNPPRLIFRSRTSSSKETQTDKKIFQDILHKEEQDFMDWMIKDRKDHLRNIQSQILNSKRELNQVKKSRHKTFKSFVADSDKEFNADSDESFNHDIELNKSNVFSHLTIETKEKANCVDNSRKRDTYFRKKRETEKLREVKKNFEEPSNAKQSKLIKEKTKKVTKIKAFKLNQKEPKSPLLIEKKNDFLKKFLLNYSYSESKSPSISIKEVVKAIENIYSAAVASNCSNFPHLHLFIYEDYFKKYFQENLVIKRLHRLMKSALFYNYERIITTFIRILGISFKLNIPSYARPKEIFNLLVRVLKILEGNYVIKKIENREIMFVALSKATECINTVLLIADKDKLNDVLFNVEKRSINEVNKIGKKIVEKEIFLETILSAYDKHCFDIEKFILEILEPFKYHLNPLKIHKFDFCMILRFFHPDKIESILKNDPLDTLENLIKHPKSKKVTSIKKLVDLCFQYKLLFPADIKNKLQDILNDLQHDNLTSGLTHEMIQCKSYFSNIMEYKEQMGIDSELLENWEHKVLVIIEEARVNSNLIILWKVLSTEIKRLLSEFN